MVVLRPFLNVIERPCTRILTAGMDEPLDGDDAPITRIFRQVNVGDCALAESVKDEVTVPDETVEVRVGVPRQLR